MFTLMILFAAGSSFQIHSSPMEFNNKIQCEVAAAQISAKVKEKFTGTFVFLCIENGSSK